MKSELLRLLCCPDCGADLKLHESHSTTADDGHVEIEEGSLTCVGCGREMPIRAGVPRLLPRHLVGEFGTGEGENGAGIERIQRDTLQYFGFEWTRFSRFGWDDAQFNLEGDRKTFLSKSLMEPEEFQDKLLLDAGCGNGRFAHWANTYGAEVVCVDLVDTGPAYSNMGRRPGVHVVQGDIFNLPFKPAVFDVIYSIGVLMHTGDAKRGTRSLLRHLKPAGTITIHLYHKGTRIYEYLDERIRVFTTKLSPEKGWELAKGLNRFARLLAAFHLLKIANIFIRLQDHPVCVYDWYSAPVASHHTYPEVYQWFEEFGLNVKRDSNRKHSLLSRLLFPPWSLTLRGQRKDTTKESVDASAAQEPLPVA